MLSLGGKRGGRRGRKDRRKRIELTSSSPSLLYLLTPIFFFLFRFGPIGHIHDPRHITSDPRTMGDKISNNVDDEEEEGEGELNPMSSSLLLPCGLLLPNRIVKVGSYPADRSLRVLANLRIPMQLPMEECLAPFGGSGSPNEAHARLYELWARGGWGMVITGRTLVLLIVSALVDD